MMKDNNSEKEEHLMGVICAFKDSYLIHKIFLASLIVDLSSVF